MAIIGGLKYLGIDEFVSALALNFVGAAAMALIAQRLKTPAWLFVIGLLGTPYLYSSLAGFSTLFFSAFYVLALYFCLQHRTAFYPLLLILCLIRPDGVWGATGSWENQCRVLTGYITSADYDVFLVPFRKTLGPKRRLFNMATGQAPRSECVRHDLYAVSRKFATRPPWKLAV